MKDRTGKFHDKLNSEKRSSTLHRGGYTLVELLVVLVILLILATGMTLGIRTWMEWSKFKKQNEYARTLYVAAQNQLTEYSVHGRLEPQVQEYISDGTGGYKNKMDFTSLKLIDSKGNLVTVDSIWPSRADKTSGTEGKYTGEVCYVMGTAKTYALYRTNPDKLETDYGREVRMLYDLLTPYLYDDSILDAAVCMEFSPDDGQVYAVLYSNIKTNKEYEFTYEHTEVMRGSVSIHSRQADYRQDRMVGYYGVDTLSKATTTKTQKPSITDVKLNNEETLNLSFRLNKIQEAINELTYTITLYDSDTNIKRMEIILDGTKLSDSDTAAQPKRIACTVIRYAQNGTKLDKHSGEEVYGRTYPFLVKQQADNTVRLVLDAADISASGYHYSAAKSALEADGELSSSSDAGKYANTYSFTRFGIDVDNVYCTVQGSGSVYKATAKKQSNVSHVYFAGGTRVEETADGKTRITNTYGIANARHLSNIRYFEEQPAAADTTVYNNYQLNQNIAWNTFIAKDALYDTANLYGKAASAAEAQERTLTDERTAFPSLPVLGAHSSLTSRGSQSYTMKGFVFSEDDNADASVYGAEEAADHTWHKVQEGPVGLFVTNKGTIQNVNLDQVQASGDDSVGAFCGVSEGVLDRLAVLNSNPGNARYESLISGRTNVGGVTGSLETDETAETTYTCKELENRARVSGTEYVGGIVGQLSLPAGAKCKIQVKDCSNYGIVEGTAVIAKADLTKAELVEEALKNRDKARYIGGIAGCLTNQTAAEENLRLTGCSSTPYYSDIAEITEDEAALQCRQNGVYVGGITGYNKNSKLENCTTESKSKTEGYIFGYRYVGGIVGYQEGGASGLDGLDGAGKSGLNDANVIGYEYVGGICGINESNTISNWTNRGVILASGKYAGGITGFNKSLIENCTCEASVDTLERNLADAGCLQGDYTGGIAGGNQGSILADATISVVSYVTGGNFVGGIVGYNEPGAEIHNYRLTGGNISGKMFVGGYAGLNASENLLREASIQSNPNMVRGDYCVGGIIGSNMTALSGDVTLRLKTDNFLGYVNAKAVAGGFIGYNFLMRDAAQVKNAALELLTVFEGQDSYEALMEQLALFETGYGSGGYDASEFRLTIAGAEDGTSKEEGQTRFGGMTADICIGGVVGYNEADTRLTIRNIENKTPVTAKETITKPEENPVSTEHTYSYAGGIIGKVTKNTVIENCSNRDEGDVISNGTYLGGICEINEGVISKCHVSNIGNSDTDYVGGITGLNKQGARISGCTFADATLTGAGYVGGIAVDNFGVIENTHVENARINAFGIGYVGGVTSRNYSSGSITGAEKQIRISIDATGDFVGAVAGINEGILSTAEIFGAVAGGQFVGGVVGYNNPADSANRMESFVNHAAVTVSDGFAGGIAGITTTDIAACENTGEVSAHRGDAGGIVSDNNAVVSNCKNFGAVSATNGISGGITAVNRGKISGSIVGDDERETLTFIGKGEIGGICGVNYGTIADSGVYNLHLENLASAVNSDMGGIAGESIPETEDAQVLIANCSVGTQQNPVELKSYAAPVNMGGVCGWNKGLITGEQETAAAAEAADLNPSCQNVYAKLMFVQQEMAYFGDLGGVVGQNDGTVRSYCFSGEVLGTSNNPALAPQYNPNRDNETNGSVIYGYGGIAGVNTGTVAGCMVGHARILGLGDANNIANIGGVAGFNDVGGSISDICFGKDRVDYTVSRKLSGSAEYVNEVNGKSAAVYVGTGSSTSAYTHAGGVCGLNSGSVYDVYPRAEEALTSNYNAGRADFSKADESSVIVESYRGHSGGIVGHNKRTGVIENVSTGKNWLVYAPENAQDNGCGGIMGYSISQMGLYNCANRATVCKMVGNGVGGMVGRLECGTSTTWEFSYCTNYGKIYGKERVSGGVGIWKYYGGTLSHCVNYGQIYASLNSGAAGGMVGTLYRVTVTPARIIECENHGTISGSNSAGGMVSLCQAISGTTKLQISGCVNTGLLQNHQNCGGILASGQTVSAADSFIENCRNYGYGIKGTNIAGISNSSITTRNCFDLADVSYPISSQNNNASNYYVTASEGTKGTGTRVSAEKITGADGYRLVRADGAQIGLSGFALDPLALTNRYGTELTITGGGTDNERYQLFRADDPYFIPVITSGDHPVTALAAPGNLVISVGGNQTCNISWSAVTDAEYYEYEVIYLDADNRALEHATGTAYRAPSAAVPLVVPAKTDIDGTPVNGVQVRVRAVRTVDGQEEPLVSDWAEKTLGNVNAILPSPKYHLELQNVSSTLKYKVFLDNQEEYREFLQANGVAEDKLDEELKLIQIKLGINTTGTTISFTAYAADSGSSTYAGTTGASDQILYATAVSTRETEKFTSSVTASRESMIPGNGPFTGSSKMASVTLKENSSETGFMGDTPDTLGYRLTMNHSGYIIYMRSELMATDVQLGIPVSVSTSQLRVSNVSASSIPTILSSMPSDILDTGHYQNLQVRSYPMMMSNNVAYMGHTVAEGLSGKEMLSYIDNGISVVTGTDAGNRKVTAGYVIELAEGEDGGPAYNIYYNTLLQYAAAKQTNSYEYPANLSKGTVGFNTQIHYYGIDETKIQRQKEPEIYVNADYGFDAAGGSITAKDGDPNQDRFVISWDAGFSKAADGQPVFENTAKYDYVVTGTLPEDGTMVQIASGSVDSSRQAKEFSVSGEDADGREATAMMKVNEVVLDASAWNYKEVSVTITRRGTINTAGLTTVFPSAGEKTVSIRNRFSQISRPTLAIVNKDSLIYNLTWNQIPAAEIASKERESYEVTVKSSGADGVTLNFAPQEEGEEALAAAAEQYRTKLRQTKALYRAKAGQTAEQTDEQSPVTYTWTDTFDGASVTKVMKLSWSEESLTITKQLEEHWFITVPEEEETVRSLQKKLDLNDFERGEAVTVSVKALAAETAVTYRDGPDGVEAALTIPERLKVPPVELLQVSDEAYRYSEDTFVTLSDFVSSGIALSLTNEEEQAYAGKYQIAVAVYEECPETEETTNPETAALRDMSKVKAGDAPDEDGDGVPDAGTGEAYWNSGAVKTLLTKESGVMMDGNLSEAVCQLVSGLDGDYAGKWLKIVLRSTSDNQISSWWTDEDEPEEETVNYKWIRLPRVQAEETEISEEVTTVYYTDQAWKLESFDNDESMVSQTTLSMNLSDYADGYRIQRVRRAESESLGAEENESYSRYIADWIYVEPAREKNGAVKTDTYNIFCASSEEQFPEKMAGDEKVENASAAVCMQDASAVFAGELNKGSALALPFKENALASDSEEPEYVKVTAILRWPAEDDGETKSLQLLLPDAENVVLTGGRAFADEDKQNYFTLQTSAQAVVLEDDGRAHYADSIITNWYRENISAKVWVSRVNTLADYQQAPQASTEGIEISGYRDVAYQRRTWGDYWQVYQVEVLDSGAGDAAVLDTRYISAYGRGSNPAERLLALPEWLYMDYEGRYVRLKTADISSDGNISRWSEAVTARLPELQPFAVETRITELGAGDTQSPVGTLYEDGSMLTELAADGVLYEWTYNEKTDPKVHGYQILVGPESGQNAVEILLECDASGQWSMAGTPLSQDTKLFDMESTAEADFTEEDGTLSVKSYTFRFAVTLHMEYAEDGTCRFSLAVPNQNTVADTGQGNTNPVTFAFYSDVTINGWTKSPAE